MSFDPGSLGSSFKTFKSAVFATHGFGSLSSIGYSDTSQTELRNARPLFPVAGTFAAEPEQPAGRARIA